MKSKIDWFNHYNKKFSSLKFGRDDLNLFYNQNKKFIDRIIKLKPKKIIEVGCGLTRDSLALAQKRISVSVFDIDKRFLKLASENAKRVGLNLKIIYGDFFELSNYVEKDYFDLVFHSGVLEHYENNEIIKILKEQIKVAPKIIFSVPIKSKTNKDYFDDNLFRRLLTKDEWQEILSDFNVVEMENIKSRHDDLLIIIER